ncbi:uncharacterized protein LOC110020902 [Phalaenopsis equestris]|uniref:uncharacterized protein LOC110020902 n=1 Tax=Phalaenopsis equestris TaxID=78828 RepID=UPI0009E2C6A7|nr:uncharacterized protein LOC110020902 [Phalaenopsis equestris]
MEHRNRNAASCEVCSALVARDDGNEEITNLGNMLENVVLSQGSLDQVKSEIGKLNKEAAEIVLAETIHESSPELPNNKCIICFFGKHKNHSYLNPKEAIFLCEDCKYKIACFYTLNVQKWHELLSPRSKKKISLFEHRKEQSPSSASSHKTGRRRRRRGRRISCEKRNRTGRKSYQQVLRQRYENGDPTVGPLGQPSGKFDYLVEYSTVESKSNSLNAFDENLFSPTGWGDTE